MKKTKKLTSIALFTTLIIVLQVVATFIKFGSFPITLTLIPIIIAGAIYGPMMGLSMGLVFGLIVNVMVVTGLDTTGASMLSLHPIITMMGCFMKGGLSGYLSAVAYQKIKKKNTKVALIVASATCPLVNTLTLFLILIIFFETSFAVALSALMTINFVIEIVINMVLAPSLMVLINKRR